MIKKRDSKSRAAIRKSGKKGFAEYAAKKLSKFVKCSQEREVKMKWQVKD
jgi:hypothetical protein